MNLGIDLQDNYVSISDFRVSDFTQIPFIDTLLTEFIIRSFLDLFSDKALKEFWLRKGFSEALCQKIVAWHHSSLEELRIETNDIFGFHVVLNDDELDFHSHDYPPSEFFPPMTEELSIWLRVLHLIPQDFFKLIKFNNVLYKLISIHPNSEALRGGNLAERTGSLIATRIWDERVLVHEIGHAIDIELAIRDNSWKKEFIKISWQDRTQEEFSGLSTETENLTLGHLFRKPIGEEFLTRYSRSDLGEDFAEHFRFFVLQPELLLYRAPSKYAFFSRLQTYAREAEEISRTDDVALPKKSWWQFWK
ncbi:MAG: hypothetical protein HYW85_04140 [Deltaproteobacteria bacterium]|nr:hypothetical protein [Deltaproteobacteria bacterium]